MIAKIEVKKQLASYEAKIKEEIKKTEDEIQKFKDACATREMEAIWKESAKYYALQSRWRTLKESLWLFQDLRCSEMLE